MLTHGLTKVSFYRSDTGDVVQLNKLTGESVIRIGTVDGDQTSPTGSEYFAGDLHELEVHSLDLDQLATLRQWQKDGHLVSAVGVGPTGALQWYETDQIKVGRDDVEGRAGGRPGFRVQMRREGHGAHNIHWGLNLLAYLGFTDADADDIADGYELTGPAAQRFNAGVQYCERTADSEFVEAPVPFPISGVSVTLSVDIVAAPVGTARGRVRATEFASTQIGSTNTSSVAIGERAVGTLVTPAGTFHVGAGVLYAQFGGGEYGVNQPALRVDGGGEYAAY